MTRSVQLLGVLGEAFGPGPPFPVRVQQREGGGEEQGGGGVQQENSELRSQYISKYTTHGQEEKKRKQQQLEEKIYSNSNVLRDVHSLLTALPVITYPYSQTSVSLSISAGPIP